MRALILNSGRGSRMGNETDSHPKCMTKLNEDETILSRQLRQLKDFGITEVIMTTGYQEEMLRSYCEELKLPLKFRFVANPLYQETNYIYSIYCARQYLDDDILLLHGDLVMDDVVLGEVILSSDSCMTVSSKAALPQKDFKAVLSDPSAQGEQRITAVGVEFFDSAVAAQPCYKLLKDDWSRWLDQIVRFCESGEEEKRKCYAENALNTISDQVKIVPLDVKDLLCREVDTLEDLDQVGKLLTEMKERVAYLCFSTDVLHGGHVELIRKAARLGKVMVGVMTDRAVASYKRFPLVSYEDRKLLFESIADVDRVVAQDSLSYRENLEKYHPQIVIHGDDWQQGFQKPIRAEVLEVLGNYGGYLIEYPYADDKRYQELDNRSRSELSTPDLRRGRLKKLLSIKGQVTAMEAHDGLTGLIVENTKVFEAGAAKQFDAMWVSSLCDSTARGKPDIELVDLTSRLRTVDEIMEVTTKPIIFDGDTGGKTEHFVYTVRTLERMGVSMIIIEDKTGLKKNSLFGTEVEQTQDSIENFSEKIRAGKRAQKTTDFMICARIESLILERGQEDAIKRAHAFVEAGADAIMIHSRKKDPEEIFSFVERFREKDQNTAIVVVPTSFNSVTEEEFAKRGVNVVIYANQLMRATVPAIQKAAETILSHHRAQECDEMCMPFSEIIRMIPEE